MPEKTFFKIVVKESARDRDYWLRRERFAPLTEGFRTADIVVVPWLDFRDEGVDVFPQGTTDFYRRLQAQTDFSVFLAATEESYREIALHADLKRLPTIILNKLAYPAFAGAIGSLLAAAAVSTPTDSVSIDLILEGDNGTCIELSYEGPANESLRTLLEQAKRCLPDQGQEETEKSGEEKGREATNVDPDTIA